MDLHPDKLSLMKSFALITMVAVSSIVSAQTFVTNNGIQIVNSADIIVNGSWTNDAGTSIKNTGTITTSESWENSGVLDPTAKGKFVLNYTADKNFTPGGNAFRSFIKKGTGNALVSGSIHVSDTLTLAGGITKLLGATDTLVMENSAHLFSSNASYVEGKFAQGGEGTKLYPIGKDGNYLPITIYKMQASKATASVDVAPGGYTRGPGVEALISFPYAWTVNEKTAVDTAAYIELGYPSAVSSLATVPNPIVVRSVSGSKYASMGARLINETTGKVIVKSYSRGLKGLYSVARGFPGDFKTDSLALVSLYNSTGGANWTTKTNWLTGPVSEWSGITVTGQSITAVNLSNNNLSGPVEDLMVDILSLQTINLSNNKITSIPAFIENPEITTLNVSGNKLEFGVLEANAGLLAPEITFNYINQADLGEPIDVLVDVGKPYQFEAATEGVNNTYQWKRNGTNVEGANEKQYALAAIGRDNMGEYICTISNSQFPGLTLKTAPNKALATAKLSGTLFAHDDEAATKGALKLYKINEKGKYDVTATKDISSDGSYSFEKIILDDYQLLGFADTLTYENALPTYYSNNTIFWEEATKLAVNDNLNDLNITSAYIPTNVAKGVGFIEGTFEEDVPAGGKIEVPKRVSGSGASVRRVESANRPNAEKLTLVAYVFTNEEGKFVLPELPVGDYRLNLQYPGYPMDETSYINIAIGEGLQSQVYVAANVEDDIIKVKKLVVTGVWEQEGYQVNVYPNPSTDYLVVRFPDYSATRSLELVNITGEKVISRSGVEKENTLHIREQASGVYLLQVKDKGKVMKTLRVLID